MRRCYLLPRGRAHEVTVDVAALLAEALAEYAAGAAFGLADWSGWPGSLGCVGLADRDGGAASFDYGFITGYCWRAVFWDCPSCLPLWRALCLA